MVIGVGREVGLEVEKVEFWHVIGHVRYFKNHNSIPYTVYFVVMAELGDWSDQKGSDVSITLTHSLSTGRLGYHSCPTPVHQRGGDDSGPKAREASDNNTCQK